MHSNSVLRASAIVAVLAIVAPPLPAVAATATSSMTVTATVLSLCTIVAGPLPFGVYASTAAVDMTATLTVSCTVTTPFDVGLGAGSGTGATVSSRKMTSGAASLNYTLYKDAARTVNWGNTVGTDTVTGVGTGVPQLLSVYGRIPSTQSVAPGVYTDTVLATITY